jgi:Chaperone of endosialidase
MKLRISCLTVVFLTLVLSAAAQVTGSGNVGVIPIWTGSTSPTQTIGNSTIFETQGMVGIGTTSPTATLHVVGATSRVGSGPTVLLVKGAVGHPSGGAINLASGPGSPAVVNALQRFFPGAGGQILLSAGNGGSGACFFGFKPPACIGPGDGGPIQITGGNGGASAGGSLPGRSGGSIALQPGLGGSGTPAGLPGNVLLAPSAGNVGIGETSPAHTLEVKVGGTTLADSWSTRSSFRFKTNIQPLQGALEKVEQLQGVSYDRRDDGRHEIGVIAEEIDKIVPEVVSHDSETNEVQGVDYSRLAALLIEAVKAQQGEIQELKAQIEQLRSNPARE